MELLCSNMKAYGSMWEDECEERRSRLNRRTSSWH